MMTGVAVATVAVALTFHVSAPNLTAAFPDVGHVSSHAVIVQPAVLPRRTRISVAPSRVP